MPARDLSTTWKNDAEKKKWYSNGIGYWEKTAETNDGVLGGYGMVHEVRLPATACFIAAVTDRHARAHTRLTSRTQ